VAFVLVMISWRIGRGYLADTVREQSPPVDRFIADIDTSVQARIPGTAIVMASQSQGIPPVLHRMVSRFRVLHERVLLATVVTEHVPHVAEGKRITIERLENGLVRALFRYGFMETPVVPTIVARALQEVGWTDAPSALVYLIGRETLVVTEKGRMGRITEPIFALLSRNVRSVTDDFSIPVEQVVEVGMQVDL